MILVIPMAGDGQRFVDAGYTQPKPLLPMPDGRTLIEHVVSSMPHVDKVITVSKPTLPLTAEMFSPFAWYPVHVKRTTRGPLDTLHEARALLNSKEELLINYCDCFLPDNQISEFVQEMRTRKRLAGVVCFPSSDFRFQREPSNKFAMSGIFWFQRASDFVKMSNGYRDDPNMSPGHLAFAIRFMGLNMASAFVVDNYVDLGVPETYKLYQALHRTLPECETLDDYLTHDIQGLPKDRMGWLMYRTLRQIVTSDETMELNGMIEAEQAAKVEAPK